MQNSSPSQQHAVGASESEIGADGPVIDEVAKE